MNETHVTEVRQKKMKTEKIFLSRNSALKVLLGTPMRIGVNLD